jgi:CelD/BcsL family acetyltransferase involved in cellulose biosynthesis
MLSVQLSSGIEAIHALANEWESLIGESFTTAFAQPAWHLAAIDVFPRKDIVVVTAREDGRLAGVLPLSRIPTDARGLYLTLIGAPGRGDYQPLVLDPRQASTVLPAMIEAAFQHYGRHGVYWFPNIPTTDPGLPVLRAFFEANNMPSVEERESAPRLRFNGGDFATVEQGWPASHRKDVRRQRKRLAEQGPVSLWQPSTLEEAQPVLEEFFRVHDAKWLSQGFPGMFQDPVQRRYFQAILRRLWGRGAHFSTVRCGDVDVSYHFGFAAGGWIQWYRPSYRPEFGVYSPSKIHIAMLIEKACQMGWNGFDFLLGAEGYKTLWCNDESEVVNIHAGFHLWAPTYFWFSRGKPFVRSKLQLSYFRARAWMQGARKERTRPANATAPHDDSPEAKR